MGRVNGKRFSHKSIVRYCDTDQMGIVYHARFLDYWEWARTDLLKELNLTYKEFENLGYFLPVKSLDIHYHHVAKYDDTIVTDVYLEEMHRSKIIFSYKSIINSKLIVSGYTKHVIVNNSFKIIKAPNEYIDKLRGYFYE